MSAQEILIKAVVSVVMAMSASIFLKRLRTSIKSGEIAAVTDWSGEAVVGHIERSEKPLLFWLVAALRSLLFSAFVAAYMWWLFMTRV